MKYLLTFLFAFSILTIAAQDNVRTLRMQANEAYDNKEYYKAGSLLEKLVEMGHRQSTNAYNASCSYALAGDETKALKLLEIAIQNGWNDYNHAMFDTDLESIKDSRSFKKLVQAIKVDSVLYVHDIVMDMVNSPDSVITYKGKVVKGDWNQDFLKLHGEYDSTTGRTYFDKQLIFERCNINVVANIGLKGLEISNYEFGEYFAFKNTFIKNSFSATFNNPEEVVFAEFGFLNCEFGDFHFSSRIDITFFSMNNVKIGNEKKIESYYHDKVSIIYVKGRNISIRNSEFLGKDKIHKFEINAERFEFTNNVVNSTLNLEDMKIGDYLTFRHNDLKNGKLSCSRTVFSEFVNEIDWSQLEGNRLMATASIPGWEFGGDCDDCFQYYEIDSVRLNKDAQITDSAIVNRYKEWAYKDLINSYYKLYTIYKDRGDLESANGCYAEMKDVMGSRLKAVYEHDGGFQNYIQWKLNRLLKIYTNHGTNLALPIVISIYVILAFSEFYFFFPSEWDITNKSKLLHDFKEFKTKNNKGYFRPFLVLLAGLFVSLINAFTLSVNAFVTLGFGAIPTKGLARYVCIMQGFIGWFLLSIFTVTLINQVLF